jgi:importin-9
LKIIKVLIEELLSASGIQTAANQAAAAADLADDEDDDGWEDLPSTLDLGLGMTKAELMSFADGSSSFLRRRDDETQAYLTDFFIKAAGDNTAGFNQLYEALTDEEKQKLQELAQQP